MVWVSGRVGEGGCVEVGVCVGVRVCVWLGKWGSSRSRNMIDHTIHTSYFISPVT